MLQQVLAVIAPIVICAMVGAGWKLCRLNYPSDFIGLLVMNVAGPCLIVKSLISTPVNLHAMLDVVYVGLLIMVVTFCIGWIVLRAAHLSSATYMPTLIFPNTANMGLPVCLFAFGEPGLTLAIGYFLFMMVAQFTLGFVLVQDGKQTLGGAILGLLKQPMIYAMVLGLGLVATGVQLPVWAENTVNLIGGVTVPLMLMALGAALVSLKVGRWWRAIWLSAARQTINLVVAVGACAVLGLSGLLKNVILIEAIMPAAVYNYLFALRFQQAPDEVAGIVVVSTFLSILILPFFVAYLT